MSKYGVTEYGFRRKLYSECLEERIEKAKKTFGVNIDVSETSFLGKLIRNLAWDETALWELAEDVYNSAFINSGEGTGLDNIGMYLTITRRPATKSKGILTVTGTNDTKVEKGFRVSTENDVIFETTADAVITGGKAEIPIISVGHGKENNVLSNSINKIVNPVFGIDSVINSKNTEGGLDIETDKEFRERYKRSYSRGGGSTVPAIEAALLDLPNVADAEVKENVTMETLDGIPPKAVACYIYGGTDEEIAKTIYQNKAAGIQAYGDTVIKVTDSKKRTHYIGFTRAKVKDIYIKVEIKKGEDYKGDKAIKRILLNYIGGIDEDNVQYNGLKLGKNVIYSKAIGSVMCQGGVADLELKFSTDNVHFNSGNVEIDKNTIARTSENKMVISYV